VVVLTEKVAGGGNTPPEATVTGVLAVTNGEPTTSAEGVAGERSYTITHNAAHKDTVTIDGNTITALKAAAGTGEFVPGESADATALLLIDLINADEALSALYTAATGGSAIINVTEDTAGGGDTPGEMTVTGTGEITSWEATASVTDGDALPATPTGGTPVAKLNVDAETAAITTGMITKLRAWSTIGVND
jgi:hypothetical protein